MLIFAIAVAGALGALARWEMGNLMVRWFGSRFPWGTLSVNLAGCFLLGLLMEIAERRQWMTAEMRITLAVGFLGSLTTFSTWEFETWRMARRGDLLSAAGNFTLNSLLGFALLWAGSRLAVLALG